MCSMESAYIAIQAVPSDCDSVPPVGRAAERSKMAMLSSPRKPPWKMLRPCSSLRFTHQVKFIDSLLNMRFRKAWSGRPHSARSVSNTRQAAQACSGGLASPNDHSYAGSAAFGCM